MVQHHKTLVSCHKQKQQTQHQTRSKSQTPQKYNKQTTEQLNTTKPLLANTKHIKPKKTQTYQTIANTKIYKAKALGTQRPFLC